MGNCDSSAPIEDIDINALEYQEERRYFYVVCPAFNLGRDTTYLKRYLKFKQSMEAWGVKLVTVECVSDKSPYMVTRQNYEPYNIQLRSSQASFQKENCINIAISKLPKDAKYVIYCDYNVEFLNKDWVNDTIRTLNMYKVAQLCDGIVLTSQNGETLEKKKGFAAQLSLLKTSADQEISDEIIDSAKYAWGFRYDALVELNGLIDFSLIGNNQKIMAYCLAQRVQKYLPPYISKAYIDGIVEWQEKVSEVCQTGVGFVDGNIEVSLLTSKEEMNVTKGFRILQTHNFDHKNDLIRDEQGLYVIKPSKVKLREDLKVFWH